MVASPTGAPESVSTAVSTSAPQEAPPEGKRQRVLGWVVGVAAVFIPILLILLVLWRFFIREVREFEGPTKLATCVAFSPDGELAAAASDRVIWVWNTHTGEEVAKLEGHAGVVNSIVFLPGGRKLLSGGLDRPRLWDLDRKTQIRTLDTPTNWVLSTAVSPDGRLAATTSRADKFIRLWDLQSGQQVLVLRGHTQPVHCVTFAGDRHLLSAGDTSVRLWEFKTISRLQDTEIVAQVLGSLGSPLACPLIGANMLHSDQPVFLGRQVHKFEGHTAPVNWVALAPDGKHFASAAWDRTIRLWDLETRKELKVLKGHNAPVVCVAFSPDGRYLVSSSVGKILSKENQNGEFPDEAQALRVWSVASGDECYHVENGATGVFGATFSPDGRYILSAGDGGKVILWRVP
jgi:WD40 repeat protein